ncbi:hypothetical protein MMC12_005787 [Toensbergia leucococca]|nr:hypothetical protein [Toensbergia leucococca]
MAFMNMMLTIRFLILLNFSFVSAQSLLNATAAYPQLSDFNQLLLSNPDAAAGLLTNITAASQKQTILIPNNDAFNNYRQATGSSVSSLSSPDLGNLLNYHSIQGALSSSDLQTPGGLVSNTALTNQTYDNRELLPNGAKLHQVVYIGSTDTPSGAKKIRVRQAGPLSSTEVRSGEGAQVLLDPTPGNWSGGNFYIIDGLVVTILSVVLDK